MVFMNIHHATDRMLILRMDWRTWVGCLILLWANAAIAGDFALAQEEPSTYFREQVLPIFRRHCFACHSHAAGEMEGGLSLDWKSGWELGGSRGPAIVPGNPEKSLLLQAVLHVSDELRMPKEKITDQEISVLNRWIENGAFDDRVTQPKSIEASSHDWWSLRPLVCPPVPVAKTSNPIDSFILSRLEKAGLKRSPPADRRTLIRRVSFDLTGLAPTPQDVEAFVTDPDANAYEKLVDRLLMSQRYGERWARHWFDTIHFADSHGYEHDIGRDHAWRYRDYVIQALNEDTSWSRFICEQLAADYLFPDEPQLIPALGFLGAGTFDLSTYSTATVTFDYLDRDDLVTQTMAAFSSTTANCARCHAHKFDPISQEDYYALQAVFAGIIKGDVAYDLKPETTRERRRLQSIIDAADRRDPSELLKAEHADAINQWLIAQRQSAQWQPLELQTYVSTEGATLTRGSDGVVLASGNKPDKDTYAITATTHSDRITALRLDVRSHDSLPMRGPGRCDNGNLHLSEIELQIFEAETQQGKTLKFKSATADFNQSAWGIERAIDGDPKTAWGIHPAVGQSHYAVFELAEPVAMRPDTKLAISLRQLHGGSHLIGAMSLSVTASDPSQIKAIPAEVELALQKATDDVGLEVGLEDRLTIAAHVLRANAADSMRLLPAKVFVYAAAPSVAIPAGEGQVQLKSLPAPKTVNVLHRGDFDKPQAIAEPGSLSVLADLPHRFTLQNLNNEAERRAALAKWLAHHDNVLTWRSAVNRVWQHHFGRGLCDTPSDFGRMGGVPSHPELIDWLAIWFRDEAQGSLKALHRLIVTSETYRQSSASEPDGIRLDSDNRLLWRQNRQRLDADAVRDFTLAASGTLDLKMGGPGVQHFKQSKGPQSTPALDYTVFDWASPGAARRSIYRYVWRGIADPFMEAMDFPDLGLLSPVRGFSASSLQALSLYNNDFVLHNSQAMAQDVETSVSGLEQQVADCVMRVWLRKPSEGERAGLTEFASRHGLAELCRVLLNSNEFLFVE